MAQTINARGAITDFSERAAVCASAACLAHCLLLPVLLALIPSLSAVLAIPELFHVWVLALAIPSAAFALVIGWRRHRKVLPLIAGAAGLFILDLGAFAVGETAWETPVTVVGSLTLAAAHLTNWRLRRRLPCDCSC